MISCEDIIFDTQSGISIEEQKEILLEINGITEKNKRSLLEAASGLYSGENISVKAKKKGFFFPLAVNIAAVLLLAGGVLSLFVFNAKKDLQIREGSGDYTLTEQVLIEELTAAQKEALLILQNLTREQERAGSIDAYCSGGIAVITEHIMENRFDQAAAAANELRIFLDTGSFETNRAFMSRKEFYAKAVESIDKLIDDVQKTGGNYVAELEEKNEHLEEQIQEMKKNLDVFNAGSSEQARRVLQLEDTLNERNRAITALETERNNLTQAVFELRSANAEHENTIRQLNDQLTTIRQALQALSQ